MNKKLLICFVMWVMGLTAFAQATFTVYDSNEQSSYVPVYGFYADAYNKCEMIMPAPDLADMNGEIISKMTWYLPGPASEAWTGNFKIYLKEVSETSLGTDFLGVDGATLVYDGTLDGTGSTLTVEFSNQYSYQGGNLLIAVYQDVPGNYKSASFLGQAVDAASITDYDYSSLDNITEGTARNFLPKTTFELVKPEAVMPTDVEVDNITATTADVNVEGVQETYNIRYRTPAEINNIDEDFTEVANGGIPEGWTVVDADGDGYNWAVWVLQLEDGSTQTTLSSNSYVNYVGALTPDNWAITPQVNLGSEISFDAWGQDPSYAAEHFQVYVSTTGTAVTDFQPISEEMVATGEQTTYTVSLGEYAGQKGYIAFRHFNVTDMYILNICNISMVGEEPDQPASEWTVIENVEVPYTIEGLTPETEYELQVQGIYEDEAKGTTNWTESVYFTTLAETVEPEEGFFLVGTFNGWNQTADGGRLTFDENDKIEGVEFEAGAEFKVIAFDENGTVWFGGQDDNNVGYFLLNNDLMGVGIMTVQGDNGANFRIEEAGTYNIYLSVLRDFNGAVYMTVTKDDPSAISTIGVDGQSNEWYNLNGQKLNGKPTVPGIYINGGKKVIVR